MWKYLSNTWILTLFLSFGMVFSQTEEELSEVVVQDDHGEVSEAFQQNFFEALKYKALDNHAKAIQFLEKCLELNVSEPAVYLELGKNYNQLNDYQTAADYLEDARKLLPENETVLTELYRAYFLDQRFDEAVSVVKQLTVINAEYSEDLANLYFLNEQYEKALQMLDRLDKERGHNDFRNGLRKQIYSMSDDVEGKVADLEARIKQEPNEEQHYLNLIFVYNEAGDFESAYKTAIRLLSSNPASELVHVPLFKFYLKEDKPVEAVQSVKLLLRGNQIDQDEKYQILNYMLLFTESKPELEKYLTEVVEVFCAEEGRPRTYEALGDFHLSQENFDEALAFFEQGLAGETTSFGLLLKALLLQIELGENEAALELNSRALEKYPTQALLYLLQGTVLNRKGAYKEASEHLVMGIQNVGKDLDLEVALYEELVVAHRALGKTKEAAEYARKVAELKLILLDE